MAKDILQNSAVLGAAGKMGSGIALLLLLEMTRSEVQGMGEPAIYNLNLIDSNRGGLDGLKSYLHAQVLKYAERNIVPLRKWFSQNERLVSNGEIIEAFVERAMRIAHFESDLGAAKESSLIFEAIIEDINIKAETYKALQISQREAFLLSNTSSIPLHILDEKAGLQGKIAGFHFYNPPPVQKLLEIIVPENISPQLKGYLPEIAKRLGKTVVYSNDIAGFIGNGHFIRDIAFALEKVHTFSENWPLHEAIYLVNYITQDFLIRPMGIFQLLDYVGIDVANKIAKIMKEFLPDLEFPSELVSRMIDQKVFGGQNSDGSQKNGFFSYNKNVILSVYSPNDKKYIDLQAGEWREDSEKEIGKPPSGYISWKQLHKDPSRKDKLERYFKNLFQESSIGASSAQEFLFHSRSVARKLVEDKVAHSIDDVNTVLELGFYHLYGADNPWIPQESTRSV